MKPGEGNGKIFVGVPRERLYIPAFVDNLIAILTSINESGHQARLFQAEGHRVDRNRDDIVRNFLADKDEPEWLLMLDSDMAHPNDIGPYLASRNKEIVGGLYFHRGGAHDPLVFLEAKEKIDRYGRSQRMWTPMRDIVYNFLIQERVPMVDQPIGIAKPSSDPLIECDALGTGTMLIHRSVFESMPAPWFEYEEGGNSEDLTFCWKAKRHGYKIYCDMSRMSGHYVFVPLGQAQFRIQYEARGLTLSSYTPAQAIEMYAKFFNILEEDAKEVLRAGSAHSFGDYWAKKYSGIDLEEDVWVVRDVYKSDTAGKNYIVELLYWNASPDYVRWRQTLRGIRGQNVLDFGAGIGTLALQMAIQANSVWAIEINSVLRDFINMRECNLLEELTTSYEKIKIMPTLPGPLDMPKMDIVFAMDVFEHLDKELLDHVLMKIAAVTKRGGRLIFSANYAQQDIYPMHYKDPGLVVALDRNGFQVVNEHEAYRR